MDQTYEICRIWWEMHVGKSTWDYAGSDATNFADAPKASGKHGATTENTKDTLILLPKTVLMEF
jgi:hypothetical protein